MTDPTPASVTAPAPESTARGIRPRRARTVRRQVHPWAWWVWALALAAVAGLTTNPLVLLVVVAVLWFVVSSRRLDTLWARAFPLYLVLGAVIVIYRVVMHVLVGLKTGETVLWQLPTVSLPAWAAGITVLGDVRLEGLLMAAVAGLRLAVILIAVGAANSLANPKRLVKALPSALGEVGTALVIAVSVAPQLVESVFRVRRARALRGESTRGIRAVGRIALPVLQDTLDRSLRLASSMDARGYGRRAVTPPAERRLTGALTLGGLCGICVGVYVILDGTVPAAVGIPLLVVGLVVAACGLAVAGRRRTVATYRPAPWAGPEWLTVGCGALALAAAWLTSRLDPLALTLSLAPLTAPAVPVVAVAGLVMAAAPGILTPPPPPPAVRRPSRGAPRPQELRRVRAR